MVRGQRPRRVRVTKLEREFGSQQPVQEAQVHSLAVQWRSYLAVEDSQGHRLQWTHQDTAGSRPR